jgi:hypothetical protein
MSRPDRLDFGDAGAVHRFIVDLRVAVDDADAITRDALRPLALRELGRILHRRNYGEARERIVALLDYATAPVPEGEPGDPAGNGGAGPVHG